ncbi:DUF7620 family protein [Blastococcus sp. SYSU D00813]
MRWPWRRRPPCASEEANAAASHATRALQDARNLASRADRVSDDLAATLRRNHFAAAVVEALRGV